MKVSFDASFDDFVDVNKRSTKLSLYMYVYLTLIVLVISGTAGALIYLVLGNWAISAMVMAVAIAATGAAVVNARENSIRSFLKKRAKITAPVPTEVELSADGLITRCLGQTIIQNWDVIENIEETDDAIYFRNKFGLYTSARKRGFTSQHELKEFLDLAKRYWSKATIPDPPAF